MFCPNFSEQNLVLKNKKGDMKSKSIVFNIEKCVDPPDKPGFCKSDEEITDLTNKLTVQLWSINSNIDMRYHGEDSGTRIHKFVSESKLREKEEIPYDLVYLTQR